MQRFVLGHGGFTIVYTVVGLLLFTAGTSGAENPTIDKQADRLSIDKQLDSLREGCDNIECCLWGPSKSGIPRLGNAVADLEQIVGRDEKVSLSKMLERMEKATKCLWGDGAASGNGQSEKQNNEDSLSELSRIEKLYLQLKLALQLERIENCLWGVE